MTNDIIKTIQDHRSIRRYIDYDIDDNILDEILETARHASSHHNIQAYSIIKVRNKDKKELISGFAADQKWIIDAPVFVIISMDFFRIYQACEMYDKNIQVDEIEAIIIGSIDSALVGQNIMIAAESKGLGGVVIGGIRNNVEELIKILHLPEYTFPVFGICLGFPDPKQVPDLKPRFPKEAVIFNEEYNKELTLAGLREYEKITEDYYNKRTNGQRTEGWPKHVSDYISRVRRPYLREILLKQGFKCE